MTIFARPVIIGVGRLVTQKAFDRLIRAHAALLGQGLNQHLVILGDGPIRCALNKLVKHLGVEQTVFMPGHVSNVRDWLTHSIVFALCSDYEGLPLVLLEALAAGLPVVSMDCPSGPREILQDGRYGRLVPAGDEPAFQHALGELLLSAKDQVAYSRLGRKRARHYSAERILPIWERLLWQVYEANSEIGGPPE